MKDKLLSFVVLPSIMFALFLAFSPVGRVEATGGDEQVTICHHNEGSKGFVKNTVDVSSIFRNNGHLIHQDGQDIIPATVFDAYDSHVEHRHPYFDWSDFEWKWTAWEDGNAHNPSKSSQQERTVYTCPSGTTTIPGSTVRCSFSGMGNQTILNNNCIVLAEVTCPTTCGYAGGQVADGDGGLKNCTATNSCSTYRWCSPDETSPTGFKARAISISIPTPDDGGKAWESGKMINQYCAYPEAGTCPNECDYPGGTVADGLGGQKTCEPTNSCSTHRWCFPEQESETGFIARAISIDVTPVEGKPWESGKMIDQYCAYPTVGVCPTECGYEGGDEVADGKGGTMECQATQACEVPDDDEEDEGEVLGATDDNSKDTGVVLAATGPTDNIVVYVVELLLVAMLVTYSVFFTKTYLKNSN